VENANVVCRENAARQREVALSLMQMALALLDRSGDSLPAIHLQYAVDTLEGGRVRSPTDDEIEKFFAGHDAGWVADRH